MSFEGYNQLLCKKGHYFNLDVYEERDIEDIKCPFCGENVAWYNIVNVTNGSYEDGVNGERIDGYIDLKVKAEAKTCTCDKCNSVHVIEVETYEIPNGGHKL